MRSSLFPIVSALLLGPLVAAGTAFAATQLSAAPHFLVLADRERVVLFADGPVAGAMADHRADGSIEITIPHVALAAALADRDFDDADSGGAGKTRVRLSSAPSGDVRVHIESASPVLSVRAFAASKPARITIDLMRVAEPSTAPGTAKSQPPSTRPANDDRGTKATGNAKGEVVAKTTVPAPFVGPPRDETAQPAAPAAAPAAHAGGVAPPAVAAITATPVQPVAHTAVKDEAAANQEDIATTNASSAKATLVCRWRRSAGVAYCGPDPKAAVYAADLGTANLAGQLDRARSGPGGSSTLTASGAAETYLNADVELMHGAKEGWLLPVVAAYEHALRAHPDFVDAPRARANVALLYHALGFMPELERLARDEHSTVGSFAGVLLADLRREEGESKDVTRLLDGGTKAGGVTACLAARVQANLAADAGKRDAFPQALADLAKVCPRTIVEDPATSWLRARVMIPAGEAPRAVTALKSLEDELPRRERALLLTDLVRAYDASGNAAAARGVDERLVAGGLGPRPIRCARMALAARDAAEGKLSAAERRFAELPIDDAVKSREKADLIAASELLRGGNEIAALGLLSERKLDPRRLAVADQLLLVRSLRRVRLLDEAQRLLKDIGSIDPARLPDGYWDELGALALARDDAAGALAIAEQWQHARGGVVPAGAVALRARGRAAKGDAKGANETLTKELAALDPEMARDVAVELAHELRSADPALAMSLARGALEAPGLPPLADERQAAALRAIAEAAKATGDQGVAQDAFARLAREHAGDPAAAGAAYRAARLAPSREAPAAHTANAAKAEAAPAPKGGSAPSGDDDPLARRMAAVGQLYTEVVAGMSPGAKP